MLDHHGWFVSRWIVVQYQVKPVGKVEDQAPETLVSCVGHSPQHDAIFRNP
jgi:hypothetical protein